jgi:hypothetical protein
MLIALVIEYDVKLRMERNVFAAVCFVSFRDLHFV